MRKKTDAHKLGGGKPPAVIRPGAIRSDRMRGHRLPRPPRPMPDSSPSVVGKSSRVDRLAGTEENGLLT
ncbi:MAG: hypothetical protein ACLP53_08175 [Isosphaeraceae bacterium]